VFDSGCHPAVLKTVHRVSFTHQKNEKEKLLVFVGGWFIRKPNTLQKRPEKRDRSLDCYFAFYFD
jgi:hypothetical protein